MSSSDEGGGADSDNEQRVAFTADTDYEDGRWIGGEFFARSEKRGRHQTREERLYGVFADGEDDEDAKFRQRKQDRKGGGGGRKREVDLTKPLNFVGSSSSAAQASTAGDAKQQQEGDDMELSDADDADAEQDDSTITEKANAAFRALLQKAEVAPAAKRPRTEQSATAAVTVQQSVAASVAAPTAAAAVAAPAPAAVKASATKTNADFRAFLMRGLQAASESNAQAAAAADSTAATPAAEDSSIARSFDTDTEHPGLGSAADPNAAPASSTTAADNSTTTQQQQQQQPVVPPMPPRPANLDAKFGDWEKHTKGIGLKLMKKMGFTGRLGKHETGVTRQLEVKLRPNGIGLGFGNFKEAATLKVNREIEADRQGKTVEELEIAMGIEPSSVSKGKKAPGAAEVRRAEAEAAAGAGLWRKVRSLCYANAHYCCKGSV
jgi:Tuftelin interacting protein N terminal/G-patch domain